MGSNQSSHAPSHDQDQQAQHHWNKLDEEHYQTYIKTMLHGDSQGKPVILGVYNRWLTRHEQKPLSSHEFESMVNDWSARAAAGARAAIAAEVKAKAVDIKKFKQEEGDLEVRPIVYFRGTRESVKMHYYMPDTMEYKKEDFKRWTKYRLVDFYPFQATQHEKADANLLCFVELQEIKHLRKNILLTWQDFINNFTPFNEEDSSTKDKHGYHFQPINWHFNVDCIKTTRTHYTPKQGGRDSQQQQSRRQMIDPEDPYQRGPD